MFLSALLASRRPAGLDGACLRLHGRRRAQGRTPCACRPTGHYLHGPRRPPGRRPAGLAHRPILRASLLPAALLWPLARPGGWARSILPAYLGVMMIPMVLVYYGMRLGIGSKVWWYFFLLLENRTIPADVVLLAVLFLSTAGILAHTLHERGVAPGALAWPAIERRGPERPSDAEWVAATGIEPRQPRRSRRRRRGPPRR